MAADDQRSVPIPEQSTAHTPRLNVFVSYSRSDTAFADEIVAGLEYDGGFNVFIDRHSIQEGEAWRDRLGGLIASADIIVFLLSKASAASELCKWEAEHAKGLSKRLVPVLIEAMEGIAAPSTLNALHYVRFDEGKSFMAGLAALRRALRADLHWIREHTRLLNRAQEWESAGHSENRLLSGPDIEAAKQWLDRRPPDAPPPLELHRDYIAASEQAEAARLGEDRRQAEQLKHALGRSRVALILTIAAGVVAAVAGIAAGVLYFEMRNVGAEAEPAIFERDTYIAEAKAELAQRDVQIADLQADLAELQLSRSEAEPAQPAEPPAPRDADVDRLEATAAVLREKLATLVEQRGDRIVVPETPVREAAESSADYAGRLEKHLAALDQQYLQLLKSPPRSPSKSRQPEPYNPRILKQQSIAPSTVPSSN